jgi:hypothetical protein
MVEEDVGRLEVAVDDGPVVQVLQRPWEGHTHTHTERERERGMNEN